MIEHGIKQDADDQDAAHIVSVFPFLTILHNVAT
jgi:hypothetical protein